jgi:pimeloyl-ACP methyl ester carboxylesterase
MFGWTLLAGVLTITAPDTTVLHRLVVAPAETMAVTLQGSGRNIVIVPGMLGGAYGFRHVTAALVERGSRVIVVEPLGTGQSSRPKNADYSFTAQAARVAMVLDSLEVRSAVLLVHALGAPIGYRLAITRGDLTLGIVSINGGPADRLDYPGVNTALKLAPILKLFGINGHAKKKLISGLRESSYDPAWITDEVIEAYGAGYAADLWGTLGTLRRMSEADDPAPLRPNLHLLEIPVLLLRSAELEQAIPEEDVEALRTGVADFTVETVAGAGQYIHEEKPEAVVAAVNSMMAGTFNSWILALSAANHLGPPRRW